MSENCSTHLLKTSALILRWLLHTRVAFGVYIYIYIYIYIYVCMYICGLPHTRVAFGGDYQRRERAHALERAGERVCISSYM